MIYGQVHRIAHRGASGRGLAPENTLAAFEKAIEIGVEAIEVDVHQTKDGEIVVCHDASLDRTTDTHGTIRNMTLAQIQHADAGVRFDAAFAGERIPTLREALSMMKGRTLALIEIKPEDITASVLEVIEEMEAKDEVVIQSFHREVVRQITEIGSDIPRALLIGGGPTEKGRRWALRWSHDVAAVGASTLSLSHGAVTPSVVEEVHRRGIRVWVWTVDEEEDMKRMFEARVDGIISNYPDRLNRVLGIVNG